MAFRLVQLPLSLFLALRYLKPKRTSVSIITLISLLGVALGVIMLILVLSVMTGFDSQIKAKVLGFEPHLLVMTEGILHDWRDLDAKLQKAPQVVATAPYVMGPVIVEFQGRRVVPTMRGVEAEREKRVTNVIDSIKEGSFDLEMDDKGNANKAVLGRELAEQLGVQVGDKITIYSPANISSIVDEIEKAKKHEKEAKSLDELQQMILPVDLTVTGIFETGRYDYDVGYLLVPLHIGQELYDLGDGLHGIAVRTKDPFHADDMKGDLLDLLASPNIEILSWFDNNKPLLQAVQMEKNMMFLIILVVTIVAAFCIVNTLLMVTMHKRREIGVLKALGAPTWQIVRIFLVQGVLVAVLGNVIGVVSAVLLIRLRNELKDFLTGLLHQQVFPASIYHLYSIPAEIVPSDVAIICGSSLLICTLGAFIPAYLAARLDPVKALRYE